VRKKTAGIFTVKWSNQQADKVVSQQGIN